MLVAVLLIAATARAEEVALVDGASGTRWTVEVKSVMPRLEKDAVSANLKLYAAGKVYPVRVYAQGCSKGSGNLYHLWYRERTWSSAFWVKDGSRVHDIVANRLCGIVVTLRAIEKDKRPATVQRF
jgi:hypothetical protein